jgi:hypothetical protein
MAVSFEAFFWAIATQESGHNYKAIGPMTKYGHAYGKYQVLAPNVGPWTKKYWGTALTPQQFLNNPQAQEAVARGQLKAYFNQYGPQGAAAMWYSGQPDPSKTYGDPPVYKYVSDVMGHAGDYAGQSTPYSGGGGFTGGGAPAVPKLDREELMEQYGLSSALINSSKELKSLFNKAVSQGWSAPRFQAALKNSKWWKTQSSTLRKYITTKFTDPATHKQNWSNAQYKINQLAVQVGLGNQIGKGGKSSALLKDAIYKSLALGWSDARVQDWLGARATTHGGVMWGEAGEAFDKMHTVAYLNGMRYSQDWYKKNAVAVASGKTTIENLEAQIRKSAAARFSAFSEQILAGQDALDLAAPYIKTVSQLLELPETEVDLFDKHVYSAMNGSKAGENYPLWQFENDVRNDPRWRKTNNARESMMTVARQVAKDFGLAY